MLQCPLADCAIFEPPAISPSPAMVAIAKEKAAGFSNITFFGFASGGIRIRLGFLISPVHNLFRFLHNFSMFGW